MSNTMVKAFHCIAVSFYIILVLQLPSAPVVGFQICSDCSELRIAELRIPVSSICHHRYLSRYRSSKPISTWRKTSLFATLEYLDDSNMYNVLFRPGEGRTRSALVDACAVWCGPCKLIEPFLAKCAEIHSDKLSVLKYDVDSPNTKNLKVEMLLQGVLVRGLPTLIIYYDGVPLATRSGAISETELNQWLEDNLFSKIDDLTGDIMAGNLACGDAKLQSSEKEQLASAKNNESSETKRGFISFGSYFGRDEYAI
eukprot:CCRYP_011390-RA/>CCRYP_011390-RA protein AED:0.03 eAED:0.03 QI:103/1/1/1/1/1/2/465/254